MDSTLQITIKSGNTLTPYEMYAIKTIQGEIAIGYYNDNKKTFRTDSHSDIALDDIVAYASIEELQDKMNTFGL